MPEISLTDVLHREAPKRRREWCRRDAEALERIGRRARSNAASRVNGIKRRDPSSGELVTTWNDVDESLAQAVERGCLAEAAAILSSYLVDASTIEVGGDPRGFGLKWRMPSGAHNDLSGLWGVG